MHSNSRTLGHSLLHFGGLCYLKSWVSCFTKQEVSRILYVSYMLVINLFLLFNIMPLRILFPFVIGEYWNYFQFLSFMSEASTNFLVFMFGIYTYLYLQKIPKEYSLRLESVCISRLSWYIKQLYVQFTCLLIVIENITHLVQNMVMWGKF